MGGGGVGGVSSARGLTGEGAEERNLISAGPGRHREEGPLCPQVTWEPKAESQAVSCGRHWSPSCPRPPPSPANVGIGLAGLHPASANVSGCEHPPDGRALKWGFVSSLGVWRSDPFSSRRLQDSGPSPPTLSLPPTSISSSPSLFIATSANCVRLSLASARPDAHGPNTAIPDSHLPCWDPAEAPGVQAGRVPWLGLRRRRGVPGAHVLRRVGVVPHLNDGERGSFPSVPRVARLGCPEERPSQLWSHMWCLHRD